MKASALGAPSQQPSIPSRIVPLPGWWPLLGGSLSAFSLPLPWTLGTPGADGHKLSPAGGAPQPDQVPAGLV